MPKKPFRINSKASVGVSTEEKKSTKPTVKDLSSSIMPSQSSQTNIQPKPVKFRLADLDEGELENSQLSLMANKVLMNRVKEDKVQYQQFLERLGLMKYYDQFWELGIDSLEGLSKVTVEDFNHLYIPAGTQIKIQKELKKAGVNQVSQTQDMGLDTSDLPSNDLNITPLRKTVETKTTPKINFGIKMKATNKPTVVTTCSMAIETDPVDSSDIPLNVNEDLPPASISSTSTKPKTKKVTFSSSGTQSDISASDQPLHEFPNYSTHNTVESAPFSFTNIGGAEWTNCFDTLNDEQRGQGRSGYIFQRGPGAVLMTPAPPNLGPSTRVSCYSCFRQLEPEEAFDHRHMPGKFFCSKVCLQREVDILLSTCEVCFQVFQKPNGVPCAWNSKWVCSEKCQSQMKPKMTQDEVLEVNLDQNLRQQAETKYQMAIREQRTDVDLDFDYQYN